MKIWLQLGNVWGKRWMSGQVATGIKCQVQAHAIFIMATKANTDATRQQHSSTWSHRLASAHLRTFAPHFTSSSSSSSSTFMRYLDARVRVEHLRQLHKLMPLGADCCFLLLAFASYPATACIFHLLICHPPMLDHLHLTSPRQTDNSQMSQQALKLFILLSK